MDKVAKFLGWEFKPKNEATAAAKQSFFRYGNSSSASEQSEPKRVSFSLWPRKEKREKPKVYRIQIGTHIEEPRPESEQEQEQEQEEEEEEEEEEQERPDIREKLRVFEWENKFCPDYRQSKEAQDDLKEDPFFEEKVNPSPEEIEENRKVWEQIKESKMIKFLARSEEIADEEVQRELEENAEPYRPEDAKLWRSLPPVPGPFNSRPIPKKAVTDPNEAVEKFWDFFKQFTFGRWNLHQRHYPPERPIDAAQVLGYKFLDDRYYDLIMRHGCVWYYKDRLGRTRGPMELPQLKTAWAYGIIDKHTFVYGDEMDEWAPISMVYGLERAVNTFDARLAASVTAITHKLAKGIPPWVPLKGHEKKTYEQAFKESIESKELEKAVMRQNGGVWPGETIPSHALFLWASGSELTSVLEKSSTPNTYVTNDLRRKLMKHVPYLRPSEIIQLEDALMALTFNYDWWRPKMPVFNTDPTYYEFAYKSIVREVRKLVFNLSDYLDDMEYLYPEEYEKMMTNMSKYRKIKSTKEPWM